MWFVRIYPTIALAKKQRTIRKSSLLKGFFHLPFFDSNIVLYPCLMFQFFAGKGFMKEVSVFRIQLFGWADRPAR